MLLNKKGPLGFLPGFHLIKSNLAFNSVILPAVDQTKSTKRMSLDLSSLNPRI